MSSNESLQLGILHRNLKTGKSVGNSVTLSHSGHRTRTRRRAALFLQSPGEDVLTAPNPDNSHLRDMLANKIV